MLGHGRVSVEVVLLGKQPKGGTSVEQTFQRTWVQSYFRGKLPGGRGTSVQTVEEAQRFRGKHRLGVSEGFDEVENGLRVGNHAMYAPEFPRGE